MLQRKPPQSNKDFANASFGSSRTTTRKMLSVSKESHEGEPGHGLASRGRGCDSSSTVNASGNQMKDLADHKMSAHFDAKRVSCDDRPRGTVRTGQVLGCDLAKPTEPWSRRSDNINEKKYNELVGRGIASCREKEGDDDSVDCTLPNSQNGLKRSLRGSPCTQQKRLRDHELGVHQKNDTRNDNAGHRNNQHLIFPHECTSSPLSSSTPDATSEVQGVTSQLHRPDTLADARHQSQMSMMFSIMNHRLQPQIRTAMASLPAQLHYVQNLDTGHVDQSPEVRQLLQFYRREAALDALTSELNHQFGTNPISRRLSDRGPFPTHQVTGDLTATSRDISNMVIELGPGDPMTFALASPRARFSHESSSNGVTTRPTPLHSLSSRADIVPTIYPYHVLSTHPPSNGGRFSSHRSPPSSDVSANSNSRLHSTCIKGEHEQLDESFFHAGSRLVNRANSRVRRAEENGHHFAMAHLNSNPAPLNEGMARMLSVQGESVSTNQPVCRHSPLPPCDESPLRHFSQRTVVPLASDEDENWLSEFFCFVRSELVEVFRASRDDVASRINSKKVAYRQVGIRCRFCAHLWHSERASRSSSFPSSMSRIYQSLTMMLRDHFIRCNAMPESTKANFLTLKATTTQGATDSKRYWIDSAIKLGMVDTPQGIMIDESAHSATVRAPLFGKQDVTVGSALAISQYESINDADRSPVLLVMPEDRQLVSEYLFTLMTQVQRVYLSDSERVGNRKSLENGLPGLGCRHCCSNNRGGLCRFFPARRRTLPLKIKDVHAHLRRCTLCPNEVKDRLSALHTEEQEEPKDYEGTKAFFDRVWTRLHGASTHSRRRSGSNMTAPTSAQSS